MERTTGTPDAAVAATALPLLGRSGAAEAAPLPKLPLTNPQAKALNYVVDERGFYLSEDNGATWTRQSNYRGGGPAYYSELFVDPFERDLGNNRFSEADLAMEMGYLIRAANRANPTEFFLAGRNAGWFIVGASISISRSTSHSRSSSASRPSISSGWAA